MSEIQINLPDSISDFAGAQVASGRFPSMDDYIVTLMEEDQYMQELLKGLKNNPKLPALLEEGLQSGPGRIWNAEYLAELKQQVYDRASQKGP